MAETQRNQLMEELRSAIRAIIGSILFTPDACIEDSPMTATLCLSIERMLLYRLQSKLIAQETDASNLLLCNETLTSFENSLVNFSVRDSLTPKSSTNV